MQNEITEIVKKALEEDVRTGDITTGAVIPSSQKGSAIFIVKQDGIIAGLEVAREVFKQADDTSVMNAYIQDGDYCTSGTIIAEVSGKISGILTAERTALNFMQRMSGIATAANSFASKINHTNAKIIDTRKTAPGLRILDKMAVRYGGCANHRIGLYDMFLIKDNHIAAAGSITKAINACRDYNKIHGLKCKIEVETTNLDEIKEAVECQPDIIMLDNFNLGEMIKAVKLINGKCLIEASGMVNADTVVGIAETGVDFISVGAITHSVKALDISLEIKG